MVNFRSRLAVSVSTILALSVSSLAHAYQGVSDDVCSRTMADFQKLAFDPEARVAIVNHGGYQNNGVCWWHSRLQRSSLYLTMYRPDLAKPNHDEAMNIVDSLISMNRVVVIPGYANFAQFSGAYSSEIISKLGSWQKREFFTGFNWIRALKGHADVNPGSLKYAMDRIYEMVNVDHRLPFEKLHIKGEITNHAWLIIGSKKREQGYGLEVIDSNYPEKTLEIDYRYGDTHLGMPGFSTWTFAPFLDFEKDYSKILGTWGAYCRSR